jgi:hypothetical protein
MSAALISNGIKKYHGAGMESRHKDALSILDELDTAISNALKKRALFNLSVFVNTSFSLLLQPPCRQYVVTLQNVGNFTVFSGAHFS